MLNCKRMRISDHYRPFEKKVLIAVTNNELARLIKAQDREVEEIDIIKTPDNASSERITAPHVSGQQDFDAMKAHRLTELYTALSKRLLELVEHDDYKSIIVCVPEVNKNIFQQALHPDVTRHIKEVVPKNLASMELHHIVRILLEG